MLTPRVLSIAVASARSALARSSALGLAKQDVGLGTDEPLRCLPLRGTGLDRRLGGFALLRLDGSTLSLGGALHGVDRSLDRRGHGLRLHPGEHQLLDQLGALALAEMAAVDVGADDVGSDLFFGGELLLDVVAGIDLPAVEQLGVDQRIGTADAVDDLGLTFGGHPVDDLLVQPVGLDVGRQAGTFVGVEFGE